VLGVFCDLELLFILPGGVTSDSNRVVLLRLVVLLENDGEIS